MYIKNISLLNFRNYDDLKINFNKNINIIYGKNAQGKTNLLESIYVLAITKSHRSFIDNNLIKKNQTISKIEGIVNKNDINSKYQIIIENKKKSLKIDENNIKKINDYISNINIIIFYPEDLDLIKGSPNIRRRFLNLELSQLNNNYLIILNDYNKILKMRNDYIKSFSNISFIDMNYFNVITNYLIEKATLIYQYRNNFIKKLNEKINIIFKDISEIDNLNIKYKNSLDFETFNNSIIKEKLQKYYEKNIEKEFKYKTTLVGPHRDDIEFYIDNLNIKNYGSQGQQRMAILSLKLSEIEIFKREKNENPILLLDDVFSELDDIKKNNLLRYINDNVQTIITTTDLNKIDKKITESAKLIKIDNGKIIKEVK